MRVAGKKKVKLPIFLIVIWALTNNAVQTIGTSVHTLIWVFVEGSNKFCILSLTLEELLQGELLLRTKLEELSVRRRGRVCAHCHHL